MSGFGQAEIVPPTSEIHIQLFDNLVQAPATIAVGQFPDPLFKPFDGFDMNPDFGLTLHVEERKAEKLAQPRAADRTFLIVYFESKGSLKNNFAEFSPGFGPGSVDLSERNHRNNELFRGIREGRSAEDGLKQG